MKNSIVAFFVGLIFAIGLGIGGMTQPHKVLGFLDVFGSWDPSLIFVMLGAVVVHTIVYRLFRHRPTPLLSTEWHIPTNRQITWQLIVGSIIFGMGWGLAGYCPGPAITSMGSGSTDAILFVVAMVVGMYVYRAFEKRSLPTNPK